MLKSTKEILDELYEISPSLKSEKGLKSLVVFMQHHTPKVKPSKDFKKKLGKKLTTIVEFQEIQPKEKINVMVFLKPIFLMAFGVFAMLQFYNFVSMEEIDVRTLPSPDTQEFTIDELTPSNENVGDQAIIETQDTGDEDTVTNETDQTEENIATSDTPEPDSQDTLKAIESAFQNTEESPEVEQTKKVGTPVNEITNSPDEKIDSQTIVPNIPIIQNNESIDTSREAGSVEAVSNTKENIETTDISSENKETRENTAETKPVNNDIPLKADVLDTKNTKTVTSETIDEGDTEETSSESGENTNSQSQGVESQSIDQDDSETIKSEWIPFDSVEEESQEGEPEIEENKIKNTIEENKIDRVTELTDIEVTVPANIKGDYYTCTGGELDFIDETDMKRIIKVYCNEMGGEFLVDGGVCKINAKQRIGIEYVERDLCE